jgi:hypothetical protein
MNKKGMSHHIEMVISFVIFIGFVFFVLIFVKPHESVYLTGSIVEGVHYNFVEYVSTDYTKIFVSVNSSNLANDCFELDLPEELLKYGGENTLVKKYDGSGEYGSMYDTILSVTNKENTSYYVFVSDDFEDDVITGPCSPAVVYRFGGVLNERVVSMEKMESLKAEYFEDNDEIKSKLAIPDVFEFAIDSEIISIEKVIPEDVEVFTRDYVERVLLSDGSTKFVRFTVKVWR